MKVKSTLGRAVLAAALIIAVSAMLVWLAPSHVSAETSRRLLGALLGAVVVVYSNGIPKVLVSRARLRRTPAEDQAARRFAGWSLVLGGLGYMLAWLLAPIGVAGLAGGVLLGAGLLAAMLRCLGGGANGSPT